MRARLGLLLAAAGLAFAGCVAPCEANADCDGLSFCDEGFCKSDCAGDVDCASTHRCESGQCIIGLIPTVRVVSPEDGTSFEGAFSIEVETEFRGVNAIATLVPEAGESCVPVFAQTEIVQGGVGVRTVRFDDVVPRGDRFSYLVRVETEVSSAETRVTLEGAPLVDVPLGARVIAPSAQVEGDAAAVDLAVTYTQLQPQVIAFTEPEFGPPSVRRIVGEQLTEFADVRVPLARGRQIIWVETPFGDVTQRCGVAVDATGGEVDETEIALSFEDEVGADLDVVVVAELDSGELFACSAKNPIACRATEDRGFRERGDEAVQMPRVPGVYGVAVVPAAVAGRPQAWVRVSDEGGHVDFLGPRRVQADLAETWLVARVWVATDDVFVEPLDAVAAGLPDIPPTAW
jgi:hypothetical protein